MVWELIGLLAASLTMFSFIPQIIKTIRIKSSRDVSPITVIQLSVGVFLWIVYGLHLKNTIIILANTITLSSLLILLFLYFKYYKG